MIGENGVSCQNVFIVIYTTQNACFVDLLYVAFKQRKSDLQYPFIIFILKIIIKNSLSVQIYFVSLIIYLLSGLLIHVWFTLWQMLSNKVSVYLMKAIFIHRREQPKQTMFDVQKLTGVSHIGQINSFSLC